MRRRRKLTIGSTVIGALVVCGMGFSAAVPAVGAQASVTRGARAVHATSAVRPPKGKPAFDATFPGRHLSTKTWATCYFWATSTGCTNFGNRQEAEWYLPSQARVSGGLLHLVAQRKRTEGTSSTGAPKLYKCRSGMITSYPGYKFKYGFVQVVANIPHAKGLWPALWLAAANGKFRPEIDMVESWGVSHETASFYHAAGRKNARARYSPRLTRGWRTYSLSWTKSSLKFYVGSKLVLAVNSNVPQQRMYFLADLAEYQPAKRGFCSGQLQIRSVKIWKA